jgi:hypothetical protein
MAGGKIPGPTGLGHNPVIDTGTMCREASPPPGVLGGPSARGFTAFRGPILVGEAARKPGFNFDGSVAEDMLYGDRPARSASIMTDPVFALNDATLNAYMRQLMESTSIGDMETVALEMQARFASGVGGTYRSSVLDAEIADNDAFEEFHEHFLLQLKAALKNAKYDPLRIKVITMNLLSFHSFWDKVSGLGITVHQVWSTKAEVENYYLSGGFWMCDLIYTFYDHFGLDWPDIEKHGEDRIPQYHTGDFFKAWYILKQYRSAVPFITEMKRKVFIVGKAT